jgi:hypothetical protein
MKRPKIALFLRIIVGLALLGVVEVGKTQPKASSPTWDHWQFLMGEWVGEGGGTSAGGFSFSTDLQGAVIVRRNFAEYPPTKNKPAYRHEDLMVIYPQAGTGTRADYFDNEGHVIHYEVTFSLQSDTLTFLSEVTPMAPRFRLRYIKTGDTTLNIRFEIAAPGNPEAFSPYIEAAAHKK